MASTAAIFVLLDKTMADMVMSLTNPLVIEFYSHMKAGLVCENQQRKLHLGPRSIFKCLITIILVIII